MALIQALRIVFACIVAAVIYGVLHDMITAHMCVEYFTVAHPFVFPSNSPIHMALIWGVIATWWVGLILGVGMAAASRLGSSPQLTVEDLVRPVLVFMLRLGLLVMLVGCIGYAAAELKWIWLVPPMSERIAVANHSRFFFDGFAHAASYMGGFVGGLYLMISSYRRRATLA